MDFCKGMIKLNLNLFEFETGFTLEQDKDFYDEDYGNNRYKILDDKSLIEIGTILNRFNDKYGRKIVPEVIGNSVYIYL